MKYVIFSAIAVALCGCSLLSRPLPPEQSVRRFAIEHQLTKRQAYDRIEVWIAETFTSAKAVIEVRQPDNGLLLGKASFSANGDDVTIHTPYCPVMYSLKAQSDDRKTAINMRILDNVHVSMGDMFTQKANKIAADLALALNGKAGAVEVTGP